MDKVSIFGSNSFIGSNFIKTYPDESIFVRSEVNYPQSNTILYLRSTTNNYGDPAEDIQVNLVKLVEFLKYLTPNHKLIFISSWFLYGLGDYENSPAKETDSARVLGYYSITKLAAEQIVETYCKINNIPFNILRLANVIGSGDNFSAQKNALQFLLSELKKDNPISLYNEGKFYRNYLHVSEVCRAIKFIIDNGVNNEIYNVGHYSNSRFIDIIKYCAEQLKSKSIISSREPSELHSIIQTPSFKMDVTKLSDLGFKWELNTQQTLDKIIQESI